MNLINDILANPGWLAVALMTGWFMYEKVLPSQLRKGEDLTTMRNNISNLKDSVEKIEGNITLILDKLIPGAKK